MSKSRCTTDPYRNVSQTTGEPLELASKQSRKPSAFGTQTRVSEANLGRFRATPSTIFQGHGFDKGVGDPFALPPPLLLHRSLRGVYFKNDPERPSYETSSTSFLPGSRSGGTL
jgi:hypothetical protein